MPDSDLHERVTVTKQRHSWVVVADALRLLLAEHDGDPHTLAAEAEPSLRGIENALGLTGEERTTDPLGMDTGQRAWLATYEGEKGEVSQRMSAPNRPAACGTAVAGLDNNVHRSLVDVTEADPETGEPLSSGRSGLRGLQASADLGDLGIGPADAPSEMECTCEGPNDACSACGGE